jgi:hypothetical protein
VFVPSSRPSLLLLLLLVAVAFVVVVVVRPRLLRMNQQLSPLLLPQRPRALASLQFLGWGGFGFPS